LSGSMGIPGEFQHPRMQQAIETVATKTKQAAKLLGVHIIAPDHSLIKKHADLGYNFIAFSIDTFFLGQKIKDELALLKN